jgi:hypothetical protein
MMQAFFEEERRELDRKRAKIRLLQQRKTADVTHCKDLPGEIPLQLVIGTKVTARLRRPQDGLFNGSIDAVDTSNNTYRITFERTGLGTHSVPDYEVLVSMLMVWWGCFNDGSNLLLVSPATKSHKGYLWAR